MDQSSGNTPRRRGSGHRTRKVIAESLKGGRKTPLEILLDIANNPKVPAATRAKAAAAAAPYVHRRQPQMLEHQGYQGGPIVVSWEK